MKIHQQKQKTRHIIVPKSDMTPVWDNSIILTIIYRGIYHGVWLWFEGGAIVTINQRINLLAQHSMGKQGF